MVFKKIIIVVVAFLNLSFCYGQKYFTRTGEISFEASTPLENIEAISNSASTVFDLETGKVQWAVLVKTFQFHKALMQEHFNENYMESSKFPKAKFTGVIDNISSLDTKENGIFESTLTGTLEIHGVEREINTGVTFIVDNGQIQATSSVQVACEDYNIQIPSVVRDKIAQVILINVKADYELLEKN